MKANNYPSWLVPIELTKRLKEIGFKGGVLSEDLTLVTKEQLSGDLGYCTFNLDDFEEGEIPTWEQVFEWFRSKGLIGNIEYSRDSFFKRTLYVPDATLLYINGIETKDKDGYFVSVSSMIIITYEEAREELVEMMIEVLKNEMSRT